MPGKERRGRKMRRCAPRLIIIICSVKSICTSLRDRGQFDCSVYRKDQCKRMQPSLDIVETFLRKVFQRACALFVFFPDAIQALPSQRRLEFAPSKDPCKRLTVLLLLNRSHLTNRRYFHRDQRMSFCNTMRVRYCRRCRERCVQDIRSNRS